MLDFFGFGRRRKTTRRKSSKTVPRKLKAMAKRYGLKSRGKSVKTLKKQLRKTIMGLIKKAKKGVKGRRKAAPKRRRRRARFGYKIVKDNPYTSAGLGLGSVALLGGAYAGRRHIARGARYVGRGFRRAGGMIYRNPGRTVLTLGATALAADQARRYRNRLIAARKSRTIRGSELYNRFGKRRRRRAPAAAMFGRRRRVGGRRRMSVPRRRRRMSRRMFGFGNGGNPALSASMGYEFCPGGGGVLGANSTGLFPSPCMAAAPAAKFGKRRRRRY